MHSRMYVMLAELLLGMWDVGMCMQGAELCTEENALAQWVSNISGPHVTREAV